MRNSGYTMQRILYTINTVTFNLSLLKYSRKQVIATVTKIGKIDFSIL